MTIRLLKSWMINLAMMQNHLKISVGKRSISWPFKVKWDKIVQTNLCRTIHVLCVAKYLQPTEKVLLLNNIQNLVTSPCLFFKLWVVLDWIFSKPTPFVPTLIKDSGSLPVVDLTSSCLLLAWGLRSLEKLFYLFIIDKLCNLFEGFYEENMASLINRIVTWRQCGEPYLF